MRIDWYRKIIMEPDMDGLVHLSDALEYFSKELETSKDELKMTGESIEKMVSMMPGIIEYRHAQLQQLVHIGKYLDLLIEKTHSEVYQKYFEKHNKALKSTDAEKYAQGDPDLINLKILRNQVEYIRSLYTGFHQALVSKNFNLGHLVKMKGGSFEDYVIPDYE